MIDRAGEGIYIPFLRRCTQKCVSNFLKEFLGWSVSERRRGSFWTAKREEKAMDTDVSQTSMSVVVDENIALEYDC